MAGNPPLQGGLTPRGRRIMRQIIMTQGVDGQTAYQLAKQAERKSPVWQRFLKDYGLSEGDFSGLR